MLVLLQVSDYSIDCNSSRHLFYRVVSYMLIAMFSMSVPMALFMLLYRNRQAQQAEVNTPKMGFVSRRMMMDLNLDHLAELQNVIVDLKQSREFGSLINAYRPGEAAKVLATHDPQENSFNHVHSWS